MFVTLSSKTAAIKVVLTFVRSVLDVVKTTTDTNRKDTKFDPATPKPLNRQSQKFAEVVTSATLPHEECY